MLSNITDNIYAAFVPLHSDYPYQDVDTVEVLGILGIDVFSILCLIPTNSYRFIAKELISLNFPMVIFLLELLSYSCPPVNLKFFTRDE